MAACDVMLFSRNTEMITRYLPAFVSALLAICVSAAGQNTSAKGLPAPVQSVSVTDVVTEGVQSVIQTMLKSGIVVDTNKARRAAILAVATAADPLARCVSADEASTIAEEGDVASQGVRQKSIDLLEKWPGEICYAKFSGLHRGTGPETLEALCAATNGSTTGMILDLRGAEGRGLDCVESMASLFVEDSREIFSICSWNGSELDRHRSGKCRRLGIPVVFLIDESTAGASELLVAIVKGGFEVLLIGRHTRGDSFIREKIELPGGEVLYIGTRRVMPLPGEDFGSGGVMPDIIVQASKSVAPVKGTNHPPVVTAKAPDTKDESGGREELVERAKSDPVLLRALDILMGLRTLDTRALRL